MNIKEICPVHKKCGRLPLQAVSYEEQLRVKEKMVGKLMGKFCKVHPIVGMENPYHYRNKVHAVFDRDRRGNIISGVYKEGTHQVIPVESCMIEDQLQTQSSGRFGSCVNLSKLKPMMRIPDTAFCVTFL